MDFTKFVDWAFYSLISAVVVYFATTMSALRKSVDNLNEKMAVEIEKSKWIQNLIERLERRLEHHENRLNDIEKKTSKLD